MLEKDIIRKEQMNKIVIKFQLKNNKKYKKEIIWNSTIYVKEIRNMSATIALIFGYLKKLPKKHSKVYIINTKILEIS